MKTGRVLAVCENEARNILKSTNLVYIDGMYHQVITCRGHCYMYKWTLAGKLQAKKSQADTKQLTEKINQLQL